MPSTILSRVDFRAPLAYSRWAEGLSPGRYAHASAPSAYRAGSVRLRRPDPDGPLAAGRVGPVEWSYGGGVTAQPAQPDPRRRVPRTDAVLGDPPLDGAGGRPRPTAGPQAGSAPRDPGPPRPPGPPRRAAARAGP